MAAIRENQVLILAGETGSGKTTQLPKMCLEAAGEDLKRQIGQRCKDARYQIVDKLGG